MEINSLEMPKIKQRVFGDKNLNYGTIIKEWFGNTQFNLGSI